MSSNDASICSSSGSQAFQTSAGQWVDLVDRRRRGGPDDERPVGELQRLPGPRPFVLERQGVQRPQLRVAHPQDAEAGHAARCERLRHQVAHRRAHGGELGVVHRFGSGEHVELQQTQRLVVTLADVVDHLGVGEPDRPAAGELALLVQGLAVELAHQPRQRVDGVQEGDEGGRDGDRVPVHRFLVPAEPFGPAGAVSSRRRTLTRRLPHTLT